MDHLPEEAQIALKHFLKRWHHNPWMQNEVGWKESASIIASFRGQSNDLRIKRILYCAKHGFLCGDHRRCVRCALDKYIEPAQEEYGQAFGTGRNFYYIVAGSEVNADKAGLHYVEIAPRPGEKDRTLHFRPWIGHSPGRAIQGTVYDEKAFLSLARAPFDLCALLTKKKSGKRLKEPVRYGAGGAFCALEFDVLFRPAAKDDKGAWFGVLCDILPHCNIILNFPFPVTFDVAKAIFTAYEKMFLRQPVRTSYPDLWIKPIVSQDDLNSRLGYSLKAWPIHKWYRRGLRNHCDPECLNAIFDNVVFDDVEHYSKGLKSPRKYGNMMCNSPAYIGKRPAKRLNNKQIKEWLEDEHFAWQHPEWEDSIHRLMEKRAKRKGRRNEGSG